MFIPEGTGPFPGILDMYGANEFVEFRAGLLAAHGFATLALNYQQSAEDVSDETSINLDDLKKAVSWFATRPDVREGGIAVTGLSLGGMLALYMGSLCPEVSAVVSISGPPFAALPFKHGTSRIKRVGYDMDKFYMTPDGISTRNAGIVDKSKIIPIWNRDVRVLIICGSDDQCLSPEYQFRLREAAPPDKRSNIRVLQYTGAGHQIEPPYSPLKRSYKVAGPFSTAYADRILFGGIPHLHNAAQERSWQDMLCFLRGHFNTGASHKGSKL
jgi:dienelactone hydrolase